MVRIAVIGSYVVGITVRVPRPPVLGEGLIGDLFDIGPGGKGTNQAIAAARLGADVCLIACLGDDVFADQALELYQREGIVTDTIYRIPGINTGVGCVTLLPSGENWIVGHLGANMHMRPEHIDAAFGITASEPITQIDILLAQFEAPIEAVARGLELAHRHDILTIWNPAPAQPIDPALLGYVDLLTPNETEARILLGLPPDDPTPTPDLARRLMALGARQVVVTLGKRGALLATEDTLEVVPAWQVTPLDPTGCGDAFNAALAVGLGEGLPLREAVAQANAAGAFCATRLGVVAGLPTRAELATFCETAIISQEGDYHP